MVRLFFAAIASAMISLGVIASPGVAGQEGPPVGGPFAVANAMLAKHNDARAQHGVPPLVWDKELERAAQAYADKMAQTEVFAHDRANRNPRQGENLWRGSRGMFRYTDRAAGWIGERAMFKPGVFPDNSTNGNWQSVSHYTQVIWPTTTSIGCASASSATQDYLVCRYWPAGNKDGVTLR